MKSKLTKLSQAAALGLALALTFSCSSDDDDKGGGGAKRIFTDARDGREYVYVEMGSKTWMAENLNYKVNGSECYDGEESNCDTYGRLYDWATAKTVCPNGWHLPNKDDWNDLMKFVNPICDYEAYYCADAGTKLKTTSGWYVVSGVPKGTDDYGFAALPGGLRLGEDYYYLGIYGVWWNASGDSNYYAISSESEDAIWLDDDELAKGNLASVRCVKN